MRIAASLALVACTAASSPAWSQRAASSPSLEGAEGPAAVPPPPAGFPAPLGHEFVYGGELQTHLEADILNATRNGTRVSVFNDSDLTAFANYRGWASLNAEGKLERNRDDNDGSYFVNRNAFFRSEGLTLRQLYATIRPVDGVSVYGGKIHPGFGSAYELAPGQFYNFGTDYEQDERVGFGVEVRLPVHGPELLGLNNVRLTAETFYLDTSVLSRSFLSTLRWPTPQPTACAATPVTSSGPSTPGVSIAAPSACAAAGLSVACFGRFHSPARRPLCQAVVSSMASRSAPATTRAAMVSRLPRASASRRSWNTRTSATLLVSLRWNGTTPSAVSPFNTPATA